MADQSTRELEVVAGHGIFITGTKYLTGQEGEGGFGSDKRWAWIKRFDFYNSTDKSDKRELFFLGYQESSQQMLDGMARLGEEADLARLKLDGLPTEDRQRIEDKLALVAERELKLDPSKRSLLPDEMDLAPYNVLVGQKLLQKVFEK